MKPELVTLDIETENTGYDIEKHNKRIISIQLLAKSIPEIFYDNSSSFNLSIAKNRLVSLINAGSNFVGFNIRNFDVRVIKGFLGIEIPQTQIIEITELPAMQGIRQKLQRNRPRLEEVCKFLEIKCTHKNMMDKLASKFKELPDVIEKAREGSIKFQSEKGWDLDFSYNYALNKICGGMAILEAYNDFVAKNGDVKSDFYQYAIGDVKVEHELFLKLKDIEGKKDTPKN